MARSCASQRSYARAQSIYEDALAFLRKNPKADHAVMRQALESYGQMLNQMSQPAKAEKIYAEARSISL